MGGINATYTIKLLFQVSLICSICFMNLQKNYNSEVTGFCNKLINVSLLDKTNGKMATSGVSLSDPKSRY